MGRFTPLLRFALGSALALGLACGGGSNNSAPPASTSSAPTTEAGILAWLQANPAVASAEDVTYSVDPYDGVFVYYIEIKEPLDHHNPSGPTLNHFVTLRYVRRDAPVVMCSTGYNGFDGSGDLSEVSYLLQGNEITMGQRFFYGAVPDPLDWSKLDVWQAASDEHVVIQTLKPLFTGRWISTGVSKGGESALFHRRFYPGDVEATVAYVAPLFTSCQDSRVPTYISTLGTPELRAAIQAWQQAILNHRSDVLSLLEADAANRGETFDLLGADRSLEFAVIEAPFVIWQWHDAAFAATVPAPTAAPSDLYAFLDAVFRGYGNSGVAQAYGDAELVFYEPYIQQCANQIGYPLFAEDSLTGILYPGEDVPATYPPFGVSKAYDGSAAIQDLQTWIAGSASRVMLVYGQNDPCTAGAAKIGSNPASRAVYSYTAPGGNHRSRIYSLSASDQTTATQTVKHWAGE